MQELLTITTDGPGGVLSLRTEKNTTETGAQQMTCLFLTRTHNLRVYTTQLRNSFLTGSILNKHSQMRSDQI